MGLISYGIGHSKAAIAAWRLLFIVLGSATIVWGMVLFLFLPDSPVRARFLNPKEKVIAINRVKENMTGIESKVRCCSLSHDPFSKFILVNGFPSMSTGI